jgi:GR25 family glycosyltransferase involved in LPS biosynthesis
MYDGFYINLKTSTKRNQELRENLKSLDLLDRYTRIEGVNGRAEYPKHHNIGVNAGSLGCSLSHMKVLQENLDNPRHLHILEDDAVLHKSVSEVFIGVCDKVEWDIIFTSVYFSFLSLRNFHKLKESMKNYREHNAVSLTNLYSIPFKGLTSYFINKDSIRKIHQLICQDTFQRKNDSYINKLVQEKKITAWVSIPFVSTLSSENTFSTINESYNSNLLALEILREAFFIDADWDRLCQKAKTHREGLDVHPLIQIYSDTNEIILDNIDKARYMNDT